MRVFIAVLSFFIIKVYLITKHITSRFAPVSRFVPHLYTFLKDRAGLHIETLCVPF